MPEITIVVFVALGAFLAGSGVTGYVAFRAVRLGWELALDDRRLEPGAVVGQLPAPAPVAEPPVWTPPEDVTPPVGQSSGPRHARTEWPTADPVDEPTEQMEAVTC